MSRMVIKSIANEVQKSKYFSVLADETKDISKTEQLSVMVRYYYNNTVNERFLGYASCSELNSKASFEFIKKTLAACGINIQNCIAQTYDGASVMSGHQNGVQAIFQTEVPKALYTHCYNHRLNLVIVDVCKNIPEIEQFITLLQQLYNFVSRSTVHMVFLDLQKKMFPKTKTIELKKLCETRWICQIAACVAVRETFSVTLLLLNKISVESKSDRSMEAKSILVHINFEFIFCLHLFCDTFSQIKIVSDYLQFPNSDIGTSCIMVESLIDYLKEFRTVDRLFNVLLEKVVLFTEINNILLPEENLMCRRTHRKLPVRFASYITELPTSENSTVMCKNDVKIIIFNPVIDGMINELQRRFSDNNPILSGISSLNPQNKSFLDFQILLPFAKHYDVDIESLESELKLIPKLIKRHQIEKKTKINTILDFIQLLECYKLAFSELYLLCTIAIIIPPSSAGVERTFSSLRQIKTYLRNKMINSRPTDIAILSIEKNISKNLDMGKVVDKFSAAHHNRKIMLI
ncbi:zinc finger MYM-type protein 1-like [Aphis craccivora]|uniref:Zinc finger MYM-type protein 1-like n=1 Tax=Aphis craccivora TaxID=307492 RepID=A0A6G0YA74_APHCR|nr:zinc finger MYM-type protein 1-like [Aphis craccivora]KAF0752006.1 zinc finger MYM-type protein 1-like [Aphis craccivora]